MTDLTFTMVLKTLAVAVSGLMLCRHGSAKRMMNVTAKPHTGAKPTYRRHPR